MRILHIHNGDMSAQQLKQSMVPGEHLPWLEALPEGPAPGHLGETDWLRQRAAFLASIYDMPYYECLDHISGQQARLLHADEYNEVVLWLEHDLFCQLTLLYLLAWFAEHPPRQAVLSLVCIDRFEGIEPFHGLGELSPPQLASLFPHRQPIRENQLALGKQAWAAYCADTPEPLCTLLGSDLSSLPFLKAALHVHLKRFPSVRNGLGHIRNQALAILADGPLPFHRLFAEFQRREPLYGLGDLQLLTRMEEMAGAKEPLVVPDSPLRIDGIPRHGVVISLTETGRRVLEGRQDYLAMQPADYWLGGVHLRSPDHLWRYDEATDRILREQATG